MSRHWNLLCCLAVSCLLVLAGCRVADPGPTETVPYNLALNDQAHTNNNDGIAYGPDSHQLLDVYEPLGTSSGLAIIFVHPNGWQTGDRHMAETTPYIQNLMDQNHVLFSIDYITTKHDDIVSPELGTYPQNFYDVQWAIGWANKTVNKNAYGYSKVVVLGASAGGLLAALATTYSDYNPPGMQSWMDPKPAAGVTLAAPLDMGTWGDQPGQDDCPAVPPAFQAFWGTSYSHPSDVHPWLRASATPHLFVDASDPPMYIASGITDCIANADHNADLLEAAYGVHQPYDQWLFPGYTLNAWNDEAENQGHNIGHNGFNAAQLNNFLERVALGLL